MRLQEFCRLSGATRKAAAYYEEQGLLHPAAWKTATGNSHRKTRGGWSESSCCAGLRYR